MNIQADLLYAYATVSGRWVSSNASPREPGNDQTYYVGEDELLAVASISGQLYTGNLAGGVDPTLEAVATISGKSIPGNVFSGLLEATGYILGTLDITYPKRHWVGWSKIGEARIVVDESNESGFSPLPGSSTALVHKVLSMDEKFPILYSTAGVYQLTPVREPFSTFGFKRLLNKGILGPGAACGDDKQHYFITKDYDIWSFSADGKLKRLGYAEFISALSPEGEMILMHYDTENMRVYISSPIGGLVLTTEGLGGGFANITGIAGQSLASPAVLVVPNQEICTDIFDMQIRGIKTIQTVAVGVSNVEDLLVAVDYRFDTKGAFVTSEWKMCNKEGVTFPIVSGVEFRIRVKNNTYDDIRIDYISARFKYVDKRFHRGHFSDNTVGN